MFTKFLNERLEFTRGLGFCLGSLLTVAILPIGLISVIQTQHLSREYERSSEISLLGRTSAAAAGERALLQGALGSADALGPVVLDALHDKAVCTELMRRFVDSTSIFAYASFTAPDGVSDCSSVGGRHDMTQRPGFRDVAQYHGALITATERDPLTSSPIVTVSQPLYRDDTLVGYVEVAMSRDMLRSSHLSAFSDDGVRILTFNSLGHVLSTDTDDPEAINALLPEGKTLPSLLSRSETTFTARSNGGERRVFSVVPVVPGLVYALGSWNRETSGMVGLTATRFSAMILPILLWAVSLIVAYFAVYRLVLRHIRTLRSQMRRFAVADRSIPPPVITQAPAEIIDMSQTFHNMARILIRDELALEHAVDEKTVLLKEVHHRVKNNLQLIASIINMQIRAIDDDQARIVLRSVQDRVASLATIYRNLYQAEHLDSVEADRLVSDIINQMANASVEPGRALRVDTHLSPLSLVPDDAVPLSLLATEAITNAMKYGGPDAKGETWVRVQLGKLDNRRAVLEVANSVGNGVPSFEGTGLGGQLIEAFAQQLEAEAKVSTTEDSFVLRVEFPVDAFHEHAKEPVEVLESRVVLTSAARGGAVH